MIVGFTGMSFCSKASSSSKLSGSSQETLLDEASELSFMDQSLQSLQEPLLSPNNKNDSFRLPKGLSKKLDDDSTHTSLEDSTCDSDDSRSSMSTSKRQEKRRRNEDNATIRKRNFQSSPRSKRSFRSIKETEEPPKSGDMLLPLHDSQTSLLSLLNAPPAPLDGPSVHSTSNSIIKGNTVSSNSAKPDTVTVFGREISKFKAGVMVSTCGGIWGGSVMIPMKMCQADTSGLGYLVSFSTGAFIVTWNFWILRLLYNIWYHRSVMDGYQALPSFHLKEMFVPGVFSGLVWSTGHFFSIISVHYLGAGVGYCVVQASMLVGGFWGICYFR